MPIHPTAIVDPEARLSETADIGPYCIIGPEVDIGPRTRIMAHVYLEGPTTIGHDNVFYPYSSIGVASQDLKYKGERAETRIGDRNKIREFVTIHRGTKGGGLITSIGSDNLLMAYTHIAHDSAVGDHCILVNGATLAGHVTIGDWVELSAFVGVHQFCRVGRHSFVGPHSVVTQDVLPYSMVVSDRELKVFGANRVGLERRGFSREAIECLQTSLRLLTRAKLNTTQAIERIRAEVPASAEVEELLEFIRASQRGVVK
jgi:UDP-N-acetylglucosamine acyltransferase